MTFYHCALESTTQPEDDYIYFVVHARRLLLFFFASKQHVCDRQIQVKNKYEIVRVISLFAITMFFSPWICREKKVRWHWHWQQSPSEMETLLDSHPFQWFRLSFPLFCEIKICSQWMKCVPSHLCHVLLYMYVAAEPHSLCFFFVIVFISFCYCYLFVYWLNKLIFTFVLSSLSAEKKIPFDWFVTINKKRENPFSNGV